MTLGKLFFRGRSQFAHASPYAAADADAAPAEQSRILHLQFGARQIDLGRTSGHQASAGGPQRVSRPLRAALAAGSGLMLKAMAWCGGCADLAFANFPIGVMSWIVTQVFAGCAAYAEAMYPTAAYAVENDDADRRDPAPGRSHGGSSRSPGLVPDLRELPRFAAEDGGKRSLFPAAGRTQFVAAASGGNEKIVRLSVTRRAPSGRLASITAIVAAWLSRRRRPRGGCQATAELRQYSRRALRGVGPLR